VILEGAPYRSGAISVAYVLGAIVLGASLSIASAIALWRGNNRKSHLQIAAGSANESRIALEVAIAWGHLDDTHTTKAQDHLDHCIAVLWKLTH
jgi:hypothetical protein